MQNWLKWLWEKTKEELLKYEDVNTWYEDEGRWYQEYTEWYWFRENIFRDNILNILEKTYFQKVFYITTSAILSSNNEEQFLNLLEKYLASYFAKRFLESWEDIDEKKTFFRAYLDLTNNEYIKQKLIMEKFDFEKFKNNNLKWNENMIIFSLVNNIYDIVDEEILKKYWV